jgi:hypothetical protein
MIMALFDKLGKQLLQKAEGLKNEAQANLLNALSLKNASDGPAVGQAQDIAVEEESVFCGQCGKKLAAGARFCPECGAPVSEPVGGKEDDQGKEEIASLPEPVEESQSAGQPVESDYKNKKLFDFSNEYSEEGEKYKSRAVFSHASGSSVYFFCPGFAIEEGTVQFALAGPPPQLRRGQEVTVFYSATNGEYANCNNVIVSEFDPDSYEEKDLIEFSYQDTAMGEKFRSPAIFSHCDGGRVVFGCPGYEEIKATQEFLLTGPAPDLEQGRSVTIYYSGNDGDYAFLDKLIPGDEAGE